MSEKIISEDPRALDQEIHEILRQYRVIAVVGLSPDEKRDSHSVALFMKNNGFQIIPVNPGVREALGEKCYPSLKDIPSPVELVNVFLKAERIPPVAEEAIQVGARAFWMQLGIKHEEAEEKLKKAGIKVVSDRCIKAEYIAHFLSSCST